jgi:hypothetical protein
MRFNQVLASCLTVVAGSLVGFVLGGPIGAMVGSVVGLMTSFYLAQKHPNMTIYGTLVLIGFAILGPILGLISILIGAAVSLAAKRISERSRETPPSSQQPTKQSDELIQTTKIWKSLKSNLKNNVNENDWKQTTVERRQDDFSGFSISITTKITKLFYGGLFIAKKRKVTERIQDQCGNTLKSGTNKEYLINEEISTQPGLAAILRHK